MKKNPWPGIIFVVVFHVAAIWALATGLANSTIDLLRGNVQAVVAVEQVAKSTPDGYTFVIASQSGMVVNPIINRNVGYDVEKDLIAVTQVTRSPLVVAVSVAEDAPFLMMPSALKVSTSHPNRLL